MQPVRRHEPPSESGIHPGRFLRGAGIGRVHDRYITSPRQVHDRLYQIQSLRGDTRNPRDMMTPLGRRLDQRAVSLTTAPCQSSTRRRATRTRSSPPWSLDEMARADPAARLGCGYERGKPAPGASTLVKNRPGMHVINQSDEHPGHPCKCNGTKRVDRQSKRSYRPSAFTLAGSGIAAWSPQGSAPIQHHVR